MPEAGIDLVERLRACATRYAGTVEGEAAYAAIIEITAQADEITRLRKKLEVERMPFTELVKIIAAAPAELTAKALTTEGKLAISLDWFKRKVELEGDLEIGAGFSLSPAATSNLPADPDSPAPSGPGTWRVVPVKPTQEMVNAAYALPGPAGTAIIEAIWAVMVAASPAPTINRVGREAVARIVDAEAFAEQHPLVGIHSQCERDRAADREKALTKADAILSLSGDDSAATSDGPALPESLEDRA